MSDEAVRVVVDIEVDERIRPPVDGWLVVRLPLWEFLPRVVVRPGLAEAQAGAFADWVARRLDRLARPDGGEPDEWRRVSSPDGHVDLAAHWTLDDLDWHPLELQP